MPESQTQYYAGIGSRETSPEILSLMEYLAHTLSISGYTLRSGGAKGADSAFEAGAKRAGRPCEIYLAKDADPKSEAGQWAHATAKAHHPAWFALRSPYVRSLMARNTFQVLGYGPDKPRSSFVLCWTPDGAETSTTRATGGTGQAIRIANAHGIPVVNLANPDALERLGALLGMVFHDPS